MLVRWGLGPNGPAPTLWRWGAGHNRFGTHQGVVGLAMLLTVLACGGSRMQPVGYSSPGVAARPGGSGDTGADAGSPLPLDFRASYTKLGDRFLSDGHAKRYQAVLWLNAPARAAWSALPAPMPDGAAVVEEAIDAERGSDRPAGLWVMQKEGGSWRFVAVGPAGEVVSDARVGPCADCHGQAPHDDLFVEVTREGR